MVKGCDRVDFPEERSRGAVVVVLTMSKLNFENMNRDELAHYMVSHRDTPEGIEARRAYIRQMAEKAKSCGIEFYRVQKNQGNPEPGITLN